MWLVPGVVVVRTTQVSMDFCEGFIMMHMRGDSATGASPRRISCDPVHMGLYVRACVRCCWCVVVVVAAARDGAAVV